MHRLIIVGITLVLLSCGGTEEITIAPQNCDKKIIISSHFADFPLPENTCPFAQVTNGTTIEQKFTLPRAYKDGIQSITTTLTNAGYTIQAQPETTIGTQKTWSAQVQKNATSQSIYTLTITNQNPSTFATTSETTFLKIQEQNLGS